MTVADKLEVAQAATTAGNSPQSALTIFDKIKRQEEQIAAALPAGMDAGRFVRMALTEVRRTPKLLECSPESVLGAMMLAAQTGLEPGGPLGQAFLVPRWNKRTKTVDASFDIGWKGYVQLAARAGVTISARSVRPGDFFEWEYGTSEFLRHRPLLDNDEDAVAWYAVGHFADGRRSVFVVIDRNITEQARDASRATSGPWVTHYDAMARKTAVRRLASYLPLSTDVALAVAVDGAVSHDAAASVEQVADSLELEGGGDVGPEPDATPADEA